MNRDENKSQESISKESTSTFHTAPRPSLLINKSTDDVITLDNLKRTNSDPTGGNDRHRIDRRSVSCDQRSPFSIADYYHDSQVEIETPGMTNIQLTVVNSVSTPTSPVTSPLSPKRVQISRNNKVFDVVLNRPNQVRAFGRRALAYQKRQWFNNICCVMLCPFLMVFFAFLLRLLIATLTTTDNVDFEFQYCSNFTSTNQQNWPIYNTSGVGIARLTKNQVPFATKNVRAVNFMSRLGLVDLAGRDPIAQLSAAAVAGSLPCVQWFGRQYPFGQDDVYEPNIEPLNFYSTRDSLYSAEIFSGWLDVLAPTRGGTDLTNPFARQALSLTRTFVSLQTRPWALVGMSPNVSPLDVGSAPKEPAYTNPADIPGRSTPYFKSAAVANGILDTIEPRVYVVGSSIPPRLTGYQKVPFFNTSSSFASETEINQVLFKSIQDSILKLSRIPPVEVSVLDVSGDLSAAQSFFNVQSALEELPYGAIYFRELNHAQKRYSYILQFGVNGVLEHLSGFPTAGFRRMIQQSQLANGIMRFSNASLATTVITQGTRAFPYLQPAQLALPFGSIIGRILYPLGISFLLPIFTLTLVKDKENRILVMLRMNGLGDVTGYYVSSFIMFYINYIISGLVFLGSGYVTSLELFTNTSWVILVIVFLIWGLVQTSMAFLFASMFRSSNIATIGAFLIVICGVVTSFMLEQVFQDMATYPSVLLIWPPFVFYRILGVLNRHATSNRLPQYTFSRFIPGDTVFNCTIVMAIQTIVVILLSIYFSQTIPSGFGSTKKWHYPITDFVYWIRNRKRNRQVFNVEVNATPTTCELDEDEDVHEERKRVFSDSYPADCPLVMKGMYKEYHHLGHKPKLAVKNVSFAVENNTVFGLLGPNGAGKTSLISILTGIYHPTQGNASLAGFDISQQPEYAFRSIGVCPQFDILWPDLNIEEHLYFYARLKGVAVDFENEAVFAALDLVQLQHLRFRQVKALSGGERRRVSIAIALVSNPKVVFLDEPTTGLDPEVRRTVWDTIARARSNRAILMVFLINKTTHSMEEAEVCCQRIGIMARGHLRCIGSPTRLKYLYGCGYRLSINPDRLDEAERFVYSVLPVGSRRLHAFKKSRRYGFTPDASQLSHVFEEMSTKASLYGIKSWGINQTTLDEIFTNVVSEEDAAGH